MFSMMLQNDIEALQTLARNSPCRSPTFLHSRKAASEFCKPNIACTKWGTFTSCLSAAAARAHAVPNMVLKSDDGSGTSTDPFFQKQVDDGGAANDGQEQEQGAHRHIQKTRRKKQDEYFHEKVVI